jgi:hypothetical protein
MHEGKPLMSRRAYGRIREELRRYTKKLTRGYTKVPKRFISEMVWGMVQSGRCLLSSISREIHGDCQHVHSDEKRLSYELSNGQWTTEQMGKNHRALIGHAYVNAETVIALDLSDVNKNEAHVYEHLTRVHDGSSGEIVDGYWAIIIEAIKKKGEHLPLLMKVFSDKVATYRSQFEEIRQAVDSVVEDFGKEGLWVMDRGFDSLRNFLYFNTLGVRFLIRGYHERVVEERDGVPEKLHRLIQQYALRGVDAFYKHYVVGHHGRRRRWQKRELTIRYDYFPICMVYGSDEEQTQRARVRLWVIVIEGMGRAGERSFFFTNIPLASLTECHHIIKKYSQRWSCEEALRFVKQAFALEDIRVQSYRAIQRMMEFCAVCYTFICLFIERCATNHKTVYLWLHDLIIQRRRRPLFAHYRILEAIQKVLNLDFFDVAPTLI